MASGAGRLGGEPAIGAIVGRRDEQQDSALIEPVTNEDGAPGQLLIVADGMGGHAGGQVASSVAVEAFAGAYRMGGALPPVERLRAALDIANRAVGARAAERPDLEGMGCTLVAALVFGDRVQWISVGDSLLVAIRDRQLIRLNADHSLAPELEQAVAEGRMSQHAADNDPDRHVLLSALSGGRIAMIDEGRRRLGAGAFVLLATDGLLSLPLPTIAALGSGVRPAKQKVTALLEAVAADMPEDQDNTTLVAVHCGAALPAKGGRAWRLAAGIALLLAALGGAGYAAWLLSGIEAGNGPNAVADAAPPADAVPPPEEGIGLPSPEPPPGYPPKPGQGDKERAIREARERAAAGNQAADGNEARPAPPSTASGSGETTPPPAANQVRTVEPGPSRPPARVERPPGTRTEPRSDNARDRSRRSPNEAR